MRVAEKNLRLRIVGEMLAGFQKASILGDSRLPVQRLVTLVQEIQALALASGLKIEILSTPDNPVPAFKTTTLRVFSGVNCILSRTVK